MAALREYPLELQRRATRMALEARQAPEGPRGAIKRVADQLGVHPEALRTWVRQAEIDVGGRPGPVVMRFLGSLFSSERIAS